MGLLKNRSPEASWRPAEGFREAQGAPEAEHDHFMHMLRRVEGGELGMSLDL